MNKKLQDIYSFLSENRAYNMPIQIGAYKLAMMPYENTPDKLYSLLYATLNSQSQLNMDKSAAFFKLMIDNYEKLNSFSGFIEAIGGNNNTPLTFKSLHRLLKKQPSWGDKTAALFVKAIYHTHIGYAKELCFWNDCPKVIVDSDELFLPVDAVIKHIFLNVDNLCKNNFKEINAYIKNKLPNTDFEVWDDLWFWGFITQKSSGGIRNLEFNEAKYWNLLDTPKDQKTIEKTKLLANQFIDLIN